MKRKQPPSWTPSREVAATRRRRGPDSIGTALLLPDSSHVINNNQQSYSQRRISTGIVVFSCKCFLYGCDIAAKYTSSEGIHFVGKDYIKIDIYSFYCIVDLPRRIHML